MSELKLVNRAIAERWDVTASHRQEILDTVLSVMRGAGKDHTKLLAVSQLLKMDLLNVRMHEAKLKAQPKHVVHHHSEMSTEELQQLVMEKMKALGLTNLNPQALLALEKRKDDLAELNVTNG